jgi:Family of unknown function (DUF5906)
MSQPTKTEAIRNFLVLKTHADLARLYSFDMEVQVNVAQDGGERVTGDFKGKQWHAWSDGLTRWKPFRIPYKANTNPEYEDKEMSFDLAAHVDGIGMTGWDWRNRLSRWFAYDFDAIIGHSEKHKKKLTHEQLQAVEKAAWEIPWVTIRKSTSGSGLHLYVFIDPIETANHNEHAAVARAILGKMAALTGFDFQSRIDVCGGNMWVWHRKMIGTDGLTLLKQGENLSEVPPNWRDHMSVVTNKRRKSLPKEISEGGYDDVFEMLTAKRPRVVLEPDHKKVIDWLEESGRMWMWNQDQHMLITHTLHLKAAFEALQLKGFFDTISDGKNLNEQNCFVFPLRKGAWAVRRYTPGVQEHDSWVQDGAGYTRCYYNKIPDLATACRAYGGLEDPSGGYVFREAETAIRAAELLGSTFTVGAPQRARRSVLKQHKTGRLIMEVDHQPEDGGDEMRGWLHKKKQWLRMSDGAVTNLEETQTENYDDTIRHITSKDEDAGWVFKSDDAWKLEPLTHIRLALGSVGHKPKEITGITGGCIIRPWHLVNMPFEPEYPGGRQWNRNAAQLRFAPSEPDRELHYPTWLKIFEHCGEGINYSVEQDPWCRASGILTGADYLKCWAASLFQEPNQPLPYLFFYGNQKSGKSIFHEALGLLLTKGYRNCYNALISKGDFNEQLDGTILAYIDEKDLRNNKDAYNKLKEWLTAQFISIHYKGKTIFEIPNTVHWVHTANNHLYCPIFSGDSRMVIINVPDLDPLETIPKKELFPRLEKEAPDFLCELLSLELPATRDRMNVEVLRTNDKDLVESLSETALETFIKEHCEEVPGRRIKFSNFYDEFIKWLDHDEMQSWKKRRVGREMPPQFPKARNRGDGQHYIGNIWWQGKEYHDEESARLVVKRIGASDYLIPINSPDARANA